MSPSTPFGAVETVLFDLDGTLCEYDQDPETVVDETFSRAGVDRFVDPPDLWRAAREVHDAEDDRHFMEQAFAVAAEHHGGPVEAAPDLAAGYGEVVDHTAVSLRPGARTALDHARERGPVGLVTNGGRETQQTKLETLGLRDAFGTTVYAGDDTPPKPAPEPFERALADLGARPDEALYVGNSLAHDVAGAKGAGLAAAWYPTDDPDDYEEEVDHDPDHVLDSLGDLPALL